MNKQIPTKYLLFVLLALIVFGCRMCWATLPDAQPLSPPVQLSEYTKCVGAVVSLYQDEIDPDPVEVEKHIQRRCGKEGAK